MDPQGWNRYSYVKNNPLSFTDPTGFDSENCKPGDPRCTPNPGPPPQSDSDSKCATATTSRCYVISDAGSGERGTKSTANKSQSPTASTAAQSQCCSIGPTPDRNAAEWLRDAVFGTVGDLAVLLGAGPKAADGYGVNPVTGESVSPRQAQVSIPILLITVFPVGRVESVAARGFESFSAFKSEFGRAGEGFNWHHIVEQTPKNLVQFGATEIHNTQNIVRVDVIAHGKVSAFYSSIQPFTNGQTVRQWLSTQPLEQQRQFGLDTLRRFGVTP